MHLGKSSVKVVDMLKDMQRDYQIERGVVKVHGLDVAPIHAKTFAASVGQRRVGVIQAPGLEPRVVLDGSKQVPLPAANLKRPDDLARRIKATNPASEQPIFESSPHSSAGCVLSARFGVARFVEAAQKLRAGIVLGKNKPTLQAPNHVVFVLAMPEFQSSALAKWTMRQFRMLR
jgi:hypothetical protein